MRGPRLISTVGILMLFLGCSFARCPSVQSPEGLTLSHVEREGPFRFVVLGDNRSGKPIVQPEVYRTNIREINLLDPDFVVIVGDLILGYVQRGFGRAGVTEAMGDAALIRAEWDEFDRVTGKFTMPYYLVVGNHDVWDEQSQAIYQERYGDLYYSFDHRGSHFVVLDCEGTGQRGQIAGAQLEWLKRDLETHREAHHVFVFLHEPLWEYGDAQSNWNREIHSLMAQYGVHAVFCGHWHNYRKSRTRDGVRYLVTGGAGASVPGSEAEGGFYHYLLVTVRGDEVKVAVIRTGHVYSEDIVTSESLDLLQGIQAAFEMDLPDRMGTRVRRPIANPSSKTVALNLRWRTEGTAWTISPAETTAVVQAGAESPLTFTISVDPSKVYPLPRCTMEMTWGGTEGLPFETFPKVDFHRSVVCQKVRVPPTLDGRLDEACWREAKRATPFALHTGERLALEQTEAFLCYNGEDLYVAFRCQDGQTAAEARAYDGAVHSDDSVELFIETPREPDYFRFAANAAGIRWDRRDREADWNAQWEAHTLMGDGYWTVEMAIPFAALEVPAPKSGASWRLNLCRGNPNGPDRWSAWSPTYGSFSQPRWFGTVVFE